MRTTIMKNLCFVGLLCAVAVLSGCFGPLAKRLADKEVYPIIDEKQTEVLGEAQPFSIEPSESQLSLDVIDQAGFSSDRFSTGGLILTLSDALALAIEDNYDYRQREETLYLSALKLTEERHEFSPIFSGAVSARAQRQPTASGGIERFGEATTDLAVTKLFATGARITVGLSNNFFRFTSGAPGESDTGKLTASIVQPLLAGGGPQVTLENLEQAERDVIYAVRDFSRFRKNFIVDRVSDYFRVLQSYDINENEYRSYQNLIVARKRAEAMEKADRMARFQVDQALQDEIRARNRWLNARTAYEQLLDSFKVNLGLPTELNIRPDRLELERLTTEGLIELGMNLDEASNKALSSRLDYLTAKDETIDAGRRLGIAENSLLPALDARADVILSDKGHNSPLDMSWDSRQYGGQIDLELPLDRKRQRNDYRRASIVLQRLEREEQRKRNNVLAEVRRAFRDVFEAQQSYEIQLTSLQLAERRVGNIAMLLEAGRTGINIRDQLEAEEDLRTARNSVTNQLVNYTIARLDFYNAIEALEIDEKGNWHENDDLGN